MHQDNYALEFLPLFYRDLEEIVDYIAVKLKNPDAAQHLVDNVFAAIDERLPNADRFEPYKSLRDLSEYRISDNRLTKKLPESSKSRELLYYLIVRHLNAFCVFTDRFR